MRRERMLGMTMLIAGLAITGLALSQMGPQATVHAQATPQTVPSPSPPAAKDDPPAEPMPGGARPTTPAPEPARPQNGTTGSSPPPASSDRPPQTGTPLPPAPAEKMGEPIRK